MYFSSCSVISALLYTLTPFTPASMTTVSSSTDTEFDDVSSFSSVDSYKPEPFTGTEDGVHPQQQEGNGLIRNDTVLDGERSVDNSTSRDINRSTSSTRSTASTHGPDNSDVHSRVSNTTLKKLDSNAVERMISHNAVQNNSESVEALKKEGLGRKGSYLPDINTPLTHTSTHAAFPEEYQIETTTGLVKLKTIETMKNTADAAEEPKDKNAKDNSDATSEDEGPSREERIRSAIERNKKDIEKYQKHKDATGLMGMIHRIFD